MPECIHDWVQVHPNVWKCGVCSASCLSNGWLTGEATPRPWAYVSRGWIEDRNGKTIGFMDRDGEFVVRAVNSYDAMRDVLEGILLNVPATFDRDDHSTWPSPHQMAMWLNVFRDRAEDALRLANGGAE
jgi:hypothetical protein